MDDIIKAAQGQPEQPDEQEQEIEILKKDLIHNEQKIKLLAKKNDQEDTLGKLGDAPKPVEPQQPADPTVKQPGTFFDFMNQKQQPVFKPVEKAKGGEIVPAKIVAVEVIKHLKRITNMGVISIVGMILVLSLNLFHFWIASSAAIVLTLVIAFFILQAKTEQRRLTVKYGFV